MKTSFSFSAFARFFRWFFSRRMIRRYLFCLAAFVTLVALFYAEENWRGKRAWENFKREWEAKGEKLDVAAIIPPLVPDDQNFYMAPLFRPLSEGVIIKADKQSSAQQKEKASEETYAVQKRLLLEEYDKKTPKTHAPELGSWQQTKVTDLAAWQSYFQSVTPAPNVAAQQVPAKAVLQALAKLATDLDAVKSATHRPYARFPVQYQEVEAALLPHVQVIRSVARILTLRAVAELHVGEVEAASEDILTCFRMADTVKNDPILISHFARNSSINVGLIGLWAGMTQHRWSDAQLRGFQEHLDKIEVLSSYQLCLRGERSAFFLPIMDRYFLRENSWHQWEMSSNLTGGEEIVPQAALASLGPRGWHYQDMVFANQYYKAAIESVMVAEQRVNPKTNAQIDSALANCSPRPWNLLSKLLLPALSGALERFARIQTAVNEANLACALERYRLAHGKLPEKLDSLAPQFIEKLPHDIINGQPLKYLRTGDGQFILYSVGWNEKDDGGVVGKNGWEETGDWVWRYPTK